VMRLAILASGAIACVLALTISSVYSLWALSSDLVYVLLFPQLLIVVYFKEHCNTYGSLVSFLLAFFLRAAGGEDVLGIPVLIKYPSFDEENNLQLFPFRTLCMIVSLVTLVVVSKLAEWIFKKEILSSKYDYFKCFIESKVVQKEEGLSEKTSELES